MVAPITALLALLRSLLVLALLKPGTARLKPEQTAQAERLARVSSRYDQSGGGGVWG